MTNPPQQPGWNPENGRYSAQNPPPQNPYGAPPPQQGQPQGGYPPQQGQPPYGQRPPQPNQAGPGQRYGQQPPAPGGYPQAQNPYPGPPQGRPQQGRPPYGAPPQNPYGGYPGPAGFPPQPPQKKSHLGLILGIVGGALALAILGTIIGASALSGQSHGAVALPSFTASSGTPGGRSAPDSSDSPEATDPSDDSGTAKSEGTATRAQLQVGDCVKDVEAGRVTLKFDLLDCAGPHQAQVYASQKLTGSAYPGEDKLVTQAKALCGGKSAGTLDPSVLTSDYQSYYLGPSETTWKMADERYLVCVVMRVDKDDFSGTKLKTQ